jgi:hypothetical protein
MSDNETPVQERRGMLHSKLNRGWLIKISVIGAVLYGIGLWGLYDATIVYPSRGFRHSEYAEFQYLAAARDASELVLADVREPHEMYMNLLGRQRELTKELTTLAPGTLAYKKANVEQTRLAWLRALRLIGRLDVAHTTFENPRARLTELSEQWQTGNTPKPLKAYDIPLQWLFCAFGMVGGLWVTLTLWRTKSKVFGYDKETRRLSLPVGVSFTPSDISELDKRHWHKFFVTVHLKEGGTHKLDLLRFAGLEEWILEMEQHTDGYEPESSDEAEESSSEKEAASTSAETPS